MSMIQSTRSIAFGIATRGVVSRMFSSECEAAERLRCVLAEYRKENFSRELPSRFRKQVLQPYVGTNGSVDVENLNLLLKNIGHPEDCLSAQEQIELLQEAGSPDRSIPVTKMMELFD